MNAKLETTKAVKHIMITQMNANYKTLLNSKLVRYLFVAVKGAFYICLTFFMLITYLQAFDPYFDDDTVLIGRFMTASSVAVFLLYKFLTRKTTIVTEDSNYNDS